MFGLFLLGWLDVEDALRSFVLLLSFPSTLLCLAAFVFITCLLCLWSSSSFWSHLCICIICTQFSVSLVLLFHRHRLFPSCSCLLFHCYGGTYDDRSLRLLAIMLSCYLPLAHRWPYQSVLSITVIIRLRDPMYIPDDRYNLRSLRLRDYRVPEIEEYSSLTSSLFLASRMYSRPLDAM